MGGSGTITGEVVLRGNATLFVGEPEQVAG
jgi:hypothetical protein